ncbi:putative ATP-dependent protease [Melioribacter roseus P3M-2]|uniref:endopeptidase La n=1 Tax=Melioribacter roseus (strain DSM 23840 / JCM 17771 / VKM B-2668 / P3M-2) TaxID=1191523 RepID=I6YVM5_MELRP|nr:AAA family ATPase [Melioribacter roseus]AFN74622.1 putative ATP-dependent protease [Melioribacter roseus P3M-2]
MPLKKAPRHKELSPSELKWTCDTSVFEFENTKSLKPIEGIVGQERALKALKIGVELRSPGYNVFVAGLSGTGKLTTIKKMLESIAPTDNGKLYDYAYVNNFKDIDRPVLLRFKAGQAKKFRKDLKSSIRFLQERIPQVLNSEPFVSRKKQLLSEYGKKQRSLMTSFEEKLRKDNFTLGEVKSGEMVRPEILALIDDKPVFVQQIQEFVREGKISSENANEIISKYSSYQEELQQVFVESLKLTQSYQEKINQLETESVSSIVKVTIDDLKKKYRDRKIKHYLEQVTENILLNIEIFKGQKPVREESEDGVVIDYLKEYEVNIILDNSTTKATPVIIETTPTYTNLFGTIEKVSDGRGGWYADFTRIKAGSILRANGGFLVINALDALGEPGVWKALKRSLLYGKLEIQDFANVYQFSPSILKPEPIEIDTKIILIGNNYVYSSLSYYEDDFNKIFKIKAEFDNVMKRSENALNEYARLIKKLIETEKLYEFDKTAIARLIEYGARYAGEKNKLTTRFAYIADLVREADFWAKDNGSKIVNAYHVDQAYNSYRERHGLYESKISEYIEEGAILIDTEGSRVGTVNGLAVYDVGAYSFGKPTRITASVSLGNGSIINVEREAGLSGKTHNKAVLIISGYFREKFGRNMNLSFSASLVFEQGYSMIDGDSASIAEICALLSAISGVPVKQSTAITGSVNQKGEVQPIGGVNEKIEGFFDVCKKRGLNGSQGVVIPHQNVKDLMLKDEVVNAVSAKRFHIYPVKTVEEAVEILTGVKAGNLLKTGKHEINTLFNKVEKELESMLKKSKQESRKKLKK